MSGYPRLAVGSLGDGSAVAPVCWALTGCLAQAGRQVRHYFSRACYGQPLGAATATGFTSGYLDPWLLSTDDCRSQLVEAYQTADFVLVEGEFAVEQSRRDLHAAARSRPADGGGNLETLARRLDLPRVIVLDAERSAGCRLPPRPDAVDGVLFDGVTGRDQFVRMQTCVEGAWGVPVLGAVERDDALRNRIADLPRGRPVPSDLCELLAARLSPYLQWPLLCNVAARPTLPLATTPRSELPPFSTRPTVAVAFDEAFCGYFPDALELFERLGARVVDFSPLASEALPEETDVVLLGCGRPDRYARELAANHCLLASLRDFARRGGRVYAEGGGAAYLARTLTLTDGTAVRLVDALPLDARLAADPRPHEPIELTFRRDCWLAAAGTTLRTYRCSYWSFTPLEPLPALSSESDLFAVGNVVAGAVQLHPASHPAMLQRLFQRRDVATGAYAGVG